MKIGSSGVFRRLLREEAGITMGLAVVMILLIGVMGAGLLTFASRDLNAVVEVNNGQKAIEVSDAGVEAAKRQLLLNSHPNSYNGDNLTDDPNKPESEWSYASASVTCGALPSGPGKCITTNEGNVRVAIRYLPPPSTEAERTNPDFAPEIPASGTDYADRDYFRVESDGIFNDARRKVQSILVTEDLGLPRAYFATKNIELKGGATAINSVSLFARGNIEGVRLDLLLGTDLAYGNWDSDPLTGAQNPYNDKARPGNATSLLGDAPGVAAEAINSGDFGIKYSPASTNDTEKTEPSSLTDRYKRLDFDGVTSISGGTLASPSPNYRFCGRDTACWPSGDQPADVITYPFDYKSKLDEGFMQLLAEEQNNYHEQAGGTHTIDESNFNQISPALSSVYFVRFTGSEKGQVNYSPNGSSAPCSLKGNLVVINGDFHTSSSGAKCFDGIIYIQDPNNLGTLLYDNLGDFTLNGYVNIEGTMKIGGSVSPLLGLDVLNHPGYHNVKIWSWRECYDETCT